jgi:ABC-type transporter MlaC component
MAIPPWCAVLLALALTTTGAAGAEDPRELIAGVSTRLVEEATSRGDELLRDPARAYVLAETVLGPLVDFTAIARRVASTHWHRGTPPERERFAREYRAFLTRILVAAYLEHLHRVAGYSRDLTLLPTRWDADRAAAVVRGRFALGGRLPLDIDFFMHRVEDGWRIHDVAIGGVSLVGVNQAAFSRELAAGGLAGLTATLRARNHGQGTADGPPVEPACCEGAQ